MYILDGISGLTLSHILWICVFAAFLARSVAQRWQHRKIYAFMKTVPGPYSLPIIGSIHHVVLGFDMNRDEWRSIRKMINPSFGSNVLATFDQNFMYHTEAFIQKLGEHADGTMFDPFPVVHLCAIDGILDNMKNTRMDVQKRNMHYLTSNMVKEATLRFERLLNPLLWPDFMFSLSGKLKLVDQVRSSQMAFINQVIQQRVQVKNLENSTGSLKENARTYLDILLSNCEAGVITEERLAAELFEIYVAGSITTALIISWAFKMMALFPDIQERAYQEVLANCNGKTVTPTDLSKLVYIEMILKETLRHFGVPVVGRKITEDLRVNEKMTIPAGIEVLLFLELLHHNPEYWEKPRKFHPEHFSAESESRRPKGAFNPFLSGPRMCPGYNYAMRISKLLLANTLLHYKFSTDENPPDDIREIECRIILMLVPLNSFRVKITKRQADRA